MTEKTKTTSSFSYFSLLLLCLGNILVTGYLVHTHITQQQLIDSIRTNNQTQQQLLQSSTQQDLQQLQQQLLQIEHSSNLPNPQQNLWQQCLNAVRTSYYHLILLGQTEQATTWLETAISYTEQIHTQASAGLNKDLHRLKKQITQMTGPAKPEALGKLNKLRDSIHALEITKNPHQASKPTTTPPPLTWQDWLSLDRWHNTMTAQLDATIQSLYNGISISTHPQMRSSILEPTELKQFQLTSELLIQQAQWGLIYKDQAIYQNALSALITDLEQRLPLNPAAEQLITDIKQLKTLAIATKEPDYQPILINLAAQIDTKTQIKTTSTNTKHEA